MNPDPKPPVEESCEATQFYVIFSELAKAAEEREVSDVTSDEIDEIEQVMRMIVDVTDEPPQFVTST